MAKISFAVLMAVHQRQDIENFFDKAINSIYQNTMLPDEFLLLIDGPVSKTFISRIKNLKSKYHFMIYQSQQNLGLAEILNLGLNKIKSQWVIRLDGDDISHRDRFKEIYSMINDKTSIISSYVNEIDEYGNKILKKIPLSQKQIIKYLKFRNPINHNAVAYNREHVLSVGGYPDLYLKEDYALWIKMIAKGYQVKNTPKVLVDANFDDRTLRRRGGLKNIKSDISLIHLLYNNNLINSFELLINYLIRLSNILLPNIIRKFIYKSLLRKKLN